VEKDGEGQKSEEGAALWGSEGKGWGSERVGDVGITGEMCDMMN
jgi:hypothetical protein